MTDLTIHLMDSFDDPRHARCGITADVTTPDLVTVTCTRCLRPWRVRILRNRQGYIPAKDTFGRRLVRRVERGDVFELANGQLAQALTRQPLGTSRAYPLMRRAA